MTSRARALGAPTLDLQAFAARATARSSHPFTLADLADDAAAGHPSQRWALSRRESGTWSWFHESNSVARFLIVRAAASIKGSSWTGSNGVDLTLTATDGTATANTDVEGIPDGLRGETLYVPPTTGLNRLSALGRGRWVIDLDTVRGVLGAATRWRWDLATSAADAYLESWTVEELPRWLIDTADSYGQLPEDYLPRGHVVDGARGLPRILATLEDAVDLSLATYHATSRDPATPWSTTSATFAALAQDEESTGVAAKFAVRPRALRGSTADRVRFAVRYRTTGMSSPSHTASVRLVTGVSSYAAVLADTAGAWADCASVEAYVKTSDASRLDTISWEGKTESGTLQVSARTVWRHPSLA